MERDSIVDAYSKDLRMSDLKSSLYQLDQLFAGIRGIKATAERAGDLNLAGKADLWMNAANAIIDSMNSVLENEQRS